MFEMLLDAVLLFVLIAVPFIGASWIVQDILVARRSWRFRQSIPRIVSFLEDTAPLLARGQSTARFLHLVNHFVEDFSTTPGSSQAAGILGAFRYATQALFNENLECPSISRNPRLLKAARQSVRTLSEVLAEGAYVRALVTIGGMYALRLYQASASLPADVRSDRQAFKMRAICLLQEIGTAMKRDDYTRAQRLVEEFPPLIVRSLSQEEAAMPAFVALWLTIRIDEAVGAAESGATDVIKWAQKAPHLLAKAYKSGQLSRIAEIVQTYEYPRIERP
jgi:hypothetical protein